MDMLKKEHDFHTLNAARLFDIDPNEVTKEQRTLAKWRYHNENYGAVFKDGKPVIQS